MEKNDWTVELEETQGGDQSHSLLPLPEPFRCYPRLCLRRRSRGRGRLRSCLCLCIRGRSLGHLRGRLRGRRRLCSRNHSRICLRSRLRRHRRRGRRGGGGCQQSWRRQRFWQAEEGDTIGVAGAYYTVAGASETSGIADRHLFLESLAA